MKKIHFFLFAALIMVTCGTTKLIQPTQTDVERGAQKYSDLTLVELNQGKTIFEQNCNLCHGLKKPNSRNEEQWKKVVPIMVGKVNKKKGTEAINGQSQEILLKYLITMSSAQAQ